MSRSTQFIGLSKIAINYLNKNALREEIKVCKECGTECGGDFVYSKGEEVLGMFEEPVHKLTTYKHKNGKEIEEYIQAEPWSSGPMIFLALRYKENKNPIKSSLWSEEEIFS